MAGINDTIYKTKYIRNKIFNRLSADENLIARAMKFSKKMPEFSFQSFPVLTVNCDADDIERLTLGCEDGEDIRTFTIQVVYFAKNMDDDKAHDEIIDIGDEIIESVKFMRDADYADVPDIAHPRILQSKATSPFCYGGEIIIPIKAWFNRT